MIFIFDECHRSQFGENHKAIKEFFPNSQLFGFTGTPIFEDNATVKQIEGDVATCPSRIRCQAATGSWTKYRQWETQRTLFSSARATVWPPAKVNGVWPFNDAWLRTSL